MNKKIAVNTQDAKSLTNNSYSRIFKDKVKMDKNSIEILDIKQVFKSAMIKVDEEKISRSESCI